MKIQHFKNVKICKKKTFTLFSLKYTVYMYTEPVRTKG